MCEAPAIALIVLLWAIIDRCSPDFARENLIGSLLINNITGLDVEPREGGRSQQVEIRRWANGAFFTFFSNVAVDIEKSLFMGDPQMIPEVVHRDPNRLDNPRVFAFLVILDQCPSREARHERLGIGSPSPQPLIDMSQGDINEVANIILVSIGEFLAEPLGHEVVGDFSASAHLRDPLSRVAADRCIGGLMSQSQDRLL